MTQIIFINHLSIQLYSYIVIDKCSIECSETACVILGVCCKTYTRSGPNPVPPIFIIYTLARAADRYKVGRYREDYCLRETYVAGRLNQVIFSLEQQQVKVQSPRVAVLSDRANMPERFKARSRVFLPHQPILKARCQVSP